MTGIKYFLVFTIANIFSSAVAMPLPADKGPSFCILVLEQLSEVPILGPQVQRKIERSLTVFDATSPSQHQTALKNSILVELEALEARIHEGENLQNDNLAELVKGIAWAVTHPYRSRAHNDIYPVVHRHFQELLSQSKSQSEQNTYADIIFILEQLALRRWHPAVVP